MQGIRQVVKPYASPILWKSFFQLANTLLPYVVIFASMLVMLVYNVHIVWVVLLAIPAAFLMVRTFILFHDCTHQSFFKAARTNEVVGTLLGILTFTPYTIWRQEHNRHHGTVGNLDERGTGDIWTMTVGEYESSSRFKKFIYQLYRHPAFLFFVAPFFLFAVLNRFPNKQFNSAKAHKNLVITNLGIGAIAAMLSYVVGIANFFIAQLLILYFASIIGVWLFFVQHQFDEVYWQRHEQWDFVRAAIEGSSFYRLPVVLEWLSGYIGYHHLHHLNPKIPNYRLKECYKALNHIEASNTITFIKSFRLAMLNLYDENRQKLITFREYKRNLRNKGKVLS